MASELIARQATILEEIKKIQSNFKKDSASRKTPQYISDRLENLEKLWQECRKNNDGLQKAEDKSHQYFTGNIFEVISSWYTGTRKLLLATNTPTSTEPTAGTSGEKVIPNGKERTSSNVIFDTSKFLGEDLKLAELKQLQNANFRALKRYVENVQIDSLVEKWEIEDKLKILQTRWNAVENLNLQIDSITSGTDIDYYDNYMLYELKYERTKRSLNNKLSSSIHQQQALPKLEIPQFFGNYTQWPTFKELYIEAIHNSPALTKTQKMQHLKGKLRGEAEKLVQHLQITAENYDVCWDLLTHRYNNKQLLFTKQFQTFLRQPSIQKQSSLELKRMYDTSMEAIHAIHNLGVDTTSWDPMLVHVLCEKLDTDTYSDYMEMRAHPRELPTLDEFMGFIEAKFTALEPLAKRKSDTNLPKPSQSYSYRQPQTFNRQSQPLNRNSKPFQQPTRSAMNPHYNYNYHAYSKKIICPLCNDDHALFQCKRFLSMSAIEQINYVTKSNICKNCLYVHTQNYCKSEKRCKECNESHNTVLHRAISAQPAQKQPMTPIPQSTAPTSTKKPMQNNFVAGSDDEILLPTALLLVTDIHGNDIILRALIDQGSQITLITENAAQRLGLKRTQLRANVSGVGTLSNKSKGKVTLHCKSLHNDFEFSTDALIMTRVVSNLPSASFEASPWEQFDNIVLADPKYNISSPIDILLDVDVYTRIMMNGLVKLPNLPMAQQTKLGWILSGAVKTYNCHVVINDTEDLVKYWEVEDITDNSRPMTSQDEYCEKLFVNTTRRLENGRYEVRLPMKENFAQFLGESKATAIAQYRQLERRLQKDEQLSASYKEFIQEYIKMGHMKESLIDTDPHCYLPHHGVQKPDSLTTRLRVVFNASQKTSSGHSLNDLMECGPKLHQDLQALLIQWRSYRFVISSDCEKMYRMILVHEDDQHLQKIVWRDTPNQPLKQYALTTVTYGQKPAPYLALRTLKQLAQDDSDKYPLAANVLNNEMYVDDVLTGSNDMNQALEIQQQLISMLQGAGFNLRKWTSNNPTLLKNIHPDYISPTVIDFNNAHTTKTLGLQWNPARDTFTFKNTLNDKSTEKLTKRVLLSEISKIFDPLGFLNPLTIKAKILFQSIWQSNCDWDDIVCIRGNQPIGRWALGRIIDTHPGKDGHIRVVTLKTQNGTMKRPITQLVPLVTQGDDKKTDEAPKNPASPAPPNTRSPRRTSKMSLMTLLCHSLLLLVTVATPTAQSSPKFALSQLNSDQTLYFDRIADMQEIKDDWKIVIYFNMTNYWQNVDALDRYVTHIRQYGRPTWITQFQLIINQLDQDMQELQYYNNLLKYHPLETARFRRGLVDGVGYLANTLFGVLDERFAEKYEDDIRLTRHNEQHLLQLIKNQTSIIEAEDNILKRNELIMNKQFQIVTEHINALTDKNLQMQKDNENAFYIMTSTMAANSMLQHLKTIQQTVLNTLTNMYHGQVDVHLLSPKQLQIELNRIARHVTSQLTLPDTQDNVRNLYNLLRIHARITNQYLIMEAKIPLLSDEQFELDKLISIPQHISKQNTIYVIPGTELIAFNINQDTFVPLEQSDLNACLRMNEKKLLCHLNHPIYDIKQSKSICNTEILTHRENHDSYCHTVTKPCTDRWIKLHKQNTWIYACCEECLVRILCPDGVASQVLRNNGLITLDQGCVLKGDTFMLYANRNYVGESIITLDTENVPDISALNSMLNTSLHHMTFSNETHEELFSNIHRDVQLLKTQSHIDGISSHDRYQYVTIGTSLTISIILLVLGVYLYCKYRTGRWNLGQQQRNANEVRDRINHEPIASASELVQVPVPSARNTTTSANQVVFDTSTDF